MKIFYFLSLLIAIMLLTCPGCRTAVTTEGKPCYGLSSSDQKELIEIARTSLLRPNKIVTPEETVRIRNSEPEIDIRYTGDQFGRAKITWDLPQRKIAVIFADDLLDEHTRRLMVEVTPKETEVIHNYRPDAPQTSSPATGKSRSSRYSRSR